jgi:predicted Zn-dependent protease
MATLADTPSSAASQPKKSRLRFWLLLATGLVLLAGAGAFGWRMYGQIREDRIVEKARNFLEEKDYGQALIAAQWAIQVSPRNISANRIMAELADVAGSPQAVSWHRAVAELEPGVAENNLNWAEAALRSSNIAMAEQALVRMPESAKVTAAYHELAARVAQASNKTAEAAAHFAKAVELEPANEKFRFGLATVTLESPDPAPQNEARKVVEQFRTHREFRQRAHRVLIQDHFRRSEWKEGFLLAAELQATPDAPFEARMLLLDLMRKFNRPELHAYLMDVQAIASRTPGDAATLLNWLNHNTMALIAADWSKSLPDDIRTRNPVPAAIAESYASLRDWPRLRSLVAEGDWDFLDFMRIALFARVLREEGDMLGFRSQWNRAVRAASSRPEALEYLARLAAASHWDTEANDLLWQVARGRDNPEWALAALLREYTAKENTRGILNVSTRRLELNPSDIVAQNNVAALSLLLNTNMERAQSLAKLAYEREPQSPGVICTYAFALHLMGETDKALKVMTSIDAAQLRHPTLASYYGVFLAEGADPQKALDYLSLATGGPMLPEERTLVAETRAKLQRRSSENDQRPVK